MWKRGEIAPKEAISPLFLNIFNILVSLSSGGKLLVHLLNKVVQFIFFLTFANLICRGTDISKYFRESLGRDNESGLYFEALSRAEHRWAAWGICCRAACNLK